MDGNSLDTLFVPEAGQVVEPVSNQAPGEPQAGQGNEPPAATEPIVGQGEPATPAEKEMIEKEKYDALRKDYTKKSMELAALKRNGGVQIDPDQSQAYIPQQQAPQAGSLAEFIQRQVAESVAEIVAPIQQQQQDLRIQAKIEEFSKNKEFEDVAPAFIERLEQEPELLGLENGLELAWDAARADFLLKSLTARTQAAAAASQQVTAQKVANTDTAPNTKNSAAMVGSQDAEAQAIIESIMGVGKRSSIF